jgi:hypothetical protein
MSPWMGDAMLIGVALWSHKSFVGTYLELSLQPILPTMGSQIADMSCYESNDSYKSYKSCKSYE